MDLKDRQLQIEQSAIEEGVERYRRLRSSQPESTMPPAEKLIVKYFDQLTKAIEQRQLAVLKREPMTGSRIWGPLLLTLPAEHLAALTLTVVINSVKDHSVTSISYSLGSRVNLESRWLKVKKENPNLIAFIKKRVKTFDLKNVKKIVRKIEGQDDEWNKRQIVHVGAVLLHVLLESTPLFERNSFNKDGKTRSVIRFTDEAWAYLEACHEAAEYWRPVHPLMVVPPVPRGLTPRINGGYLSIATPYIKSQSKSSNRFNSCVLSEDAATLEGLNILQGTPWRINRPVLDTLQQLWATDNPVGSMPQREDAELPEVPPDIDEDPEVKRKWKLAAVQVHNYNASLRSKRQQFILKNLVAKEYCDDTFWSPWDLDYRGRAYPLANHLQPQADDSTKALFLFADEKPLGESGLKWLKRHLANKFGEDKVSWADREKWTEDLAPDIIRSGEEPLDHISFWSQADDPFQFLAGCIEYAQAMKLSDPADHVSSLPINIDGTCNGLQHYAGLGLDPQGAAAVNLVHGDKPSDVYSEVLELVKGEVGKDSYSLDVSLRAMAKAWLPHLTRPVVKRGIMTYPYGVTPYGMRAQLINDGFTLNVKADASEAAGYLMHKVWEAVPKVIEAAPKYMEWLHSVSETCTNEDSPIIWDTPSGFRAAQDYRSFKNQQIVTILQSVKIADNSDSAPRNGRKQRTSLPPNFIHSMDAAHQMLTLRECRKAGLSSFMMIHDSYGTHAGDMDTLAAATRQTFVDIYSQNQIRNFRQSILRNTGIEVPEAPLRGDFDITEVLTSEYFFG